MNAIASTSAPKGGRPPLDRQVLAVQNASVLQALGLCASAPGLTELATAAGKDASNLRKTLLNLEAVGLVTMEPIALTDEGQDMLHRLDVLAGDAPADAPMTEMMPAGMVGRRHRDIFPDPNNPRTSSGVSDADILETADSMVEKGILQKISVREAISDAASDDYGRSQLQDGYRRWRAWGLNIERGIWSADRIEICSIFVGDDLEATEAALIANDQRSNLHNLERGETYLRLSATYKRSAAEIGRSTGREERFVQIAMQVAELATQENKDKFIASQQARARKEKATCTWEELRESVRTPKHITELAKHPRLALMVAELALRAQIDAACHDIADSRAYLRVQAPPGGGHFTTGLDLKLIEAEYEDGKVFARCAELGWKWLTTEGFDDDGTKFVHALRVEALGETGAILAGERGYGTVWVNRPKDPLPQVMADPEETAPPAMITTGRPSLADRFAAAHGAQNALPPARDSFAEQIRRVNAAEDAENDYEADVPPPPRPAPAEPIVTGPTLSPRARVALIELRHAIGGPAAIEARGGAIVGAEVFSYHTDNASQELTKHRLAGFMPTPGGKGWMAHITPAGDQWLLDGGFGQGVSDAAVAVEVAKAGFQAGDAYVTPWLNRPAAPATPARPSFGEALQELITTRKAMGDAQASDLQAATALDHLATAVGRAATGQVPAGDAAPEVEDDDEIVETPPMPFHLVADQGDRAIQIGVWTEEDGRQVGKAFAESGHFEVVTLRDRAGALLVTWDE